VKKSTFCVAALGIVWAGGAYSADLPVKAYTKAPPMMQQVFSWTGFYIGAQAGYLSANTNASAADTASIVATYGRMPRPKGGFAGLQGGYNYEFANNVVIGIETSVLGLGVNGLKDTLGIPLTSSLSVATDWDVGVVGRLGYAIDRWLPYGFAGAMWTHDKERGFNPFIGAFALSNTHSGWTTGAGLEYAFLNNWSARIQYRYSWVDRQIYNRVNVGGSGSSGDVAVNYHF
jgi:outer membrane immunogenic protein